MSFLGRDWSFSFRKLYSDGRQSTSAICESPFLAEIGHSSFGKSTPTADRVLPQSAKAHSWPRLVILRSEIVLQRPTEYFRNLRMSILGQDWSFSVRKLYSDGRQSTSAICERPFLAEIGQSSVGNCTPTADRVLPQQRKTKNLCTYAKNRERMMRNWRKMRIFAALLNIIRCVFR